MIPLLSRYPEVTPSGAFLNGLRGRRTTQSATGSRSSIPSTTARCRTAAPLAQVWAALVRATLCRHGTAEMEADARLALRGLPRPASGPTALAPRVSLLFEGGDGRAGARGSGGGSRQRGDLPGRDRTFRACASGSRAGGWGEGGGRSCRRPGAPREPAPRGVRPGGDLPCRVRASRVRPWPGCHCARSARPRDALARHTNARRPWFGVHELELARPLRARRHRGRSRTLCREAPGRHQPATRSGRFGRRRTSCETGSQVSRALTTAGPRR